MKYVNDTFCGTYCGACPTMVETKAGRKVHRTTAIALPLSPSGKHDHPLGILMNNQEV